MRFSCFQALQKYFLQNVCKCWKRLYIFVASIHEKAKAMRNTKVSNGMYFIVPCLRRYGWEVVFFPKQPGQPAMYKYFLLFHDAEEFILDAYKQDKQKIVKPWQ